MAKITIPQFKTPYNFDPDSHSDATGLACEDVSLTHQSFKDECDINNIVRQFGVTGQVTVPEGREPTYGDFTGTNDYREALDIIREAENAFMELPSAIRERFKNDPAEFVEFIHDESNRSEAEQLGLVAPREQPSTSPTETTVTDPA